MISQVSGNCCYAWGPNFKSLNNSKFNWKNVKPWDWFSQHSGVVWCFQAPSLLVLGWHPWDRGCLEGPGGVLGLEDTWWLPCRLQVGLLPNLFSGKSCIWNDLITLETYSWIILEWSESMCGSSRAIGLVVGQQNGCIVLRVGWVCVTIPINVVSTNLLVVLVWLPCTLWCVNWGFMFCSSVASTMQEGCPWGAPWVPLFWGLSLWSLVLLHPNSCFKSSLSPCQRTPKCLVANDKENRTSVKLSPISHLITMRLHK